MQRSLRHGRRSLDNVIAIGMGFQGADAMQKGGEVHVGPCRIGSWLTTTVGCSKPW